MNTSVEISYYPLNDEFILHVLDFINRMKNYKNLYIKSNGMSTKVFGKYFDVMNALTEEIHKSFELPHSVFVLKIVNADLNIT